MKIFIPFNVPSSKNSKVATRKGVFHSKTVSKYLQKIGVKAFSARSGVQNYKTRTNIFAKSIKPLEQALRDSEPPYLIGFHFVRNSRHKFDFHNAIQIVADLMVAHGVIEDDNMNFFIPYPFQVDGEWFSYDKENPGVWIKFEGVMP